MQMSILIAPDSFKGSSHCVGSGRGEGLVDSLVSASGGRLLEYEVTGPLGTPVQAKMGLMGGGQTAVIEMAQASGLILVPRDKRNPLVTTTYGTGELIRKALDLGCDHLIIGIGGSATNDGGMGMAQALGFLFLDENETPWDKAAAN